MIKGPGGFELQLVKTGAETDGEVLEMEATYPGDARSRRSTSIRGRRSGSR